MEEVDPPPEENIGSVLRRLVRPLYLPTFLVSLGNGMLIPILPLYLRDVGMSYQLLTVVLAAAGVGGLVGQVPIGAAINRFGERRTVVGAIGLLAVSIAVLGLITTTVALAAFRFVGGLAATGWSLSPQSMVSTAVAPAVRGRVSSTFGGVARVAWLLGPLLGGFIAAEFGYTAAFAATGVITVTGIVPILSAQTAGVMAPPQKRSARIRSSVVFRDNRGPLLAASAVSIGVAAAREGRKVVIPLLGAALGLDVARVGVLVAVGAASDILLFPLAGWLMDRFTRLAASVPALTLLAVGLFVAATANSPDMLMVGAAITGLGNGVGSGMMLTIGADIAPPGNVVQFLALLGSARESGRVFGPVAVGVVADSIGLAASAAVLGVIALVAAAVLILVLGNTRDAQVGLRPTRA